MSHVTTSAVTTVAGFGRTEIAPEAQLASSERFHDFLESYVHPEIPKHSEPTQKTSTVKSQATTVEPRTSGNETSKTSTKTVSSPKVTAGQSAVFPLKDHTPLSRPVSASGHSTLPVASQEAVPDDSKKQSSGVSLQEKSLQSVTQKSDDKSLPTGSLSQSEDTVLEMKSDDPVERNTTASCMEEAGSIDISTENAVSETASPINDSSINNNSNTVSDDSSSDINHEKQNISVSNVENNFKLEEAFVPENSHISLDSVSSEKLSSASVEETPSERQAENKTIAPDDDEDTSRRADQHTILYQQQNNGNTTTHIEMNVGLNEKIHVEIDGAGSKEHRIHINTDNPQIYQSLKDDRDTLIVALSDNSTLVAGAQFSTGADLQISLSLSALNDMSLHDERQEGSNRSPESPRDSKSGASNSVTERRLLRGVVDLTV